MHDLPLYRELCKMNKMDAKFSEMTLKHGENMNFSKSSIKNIQEIIFYRKKNGLIVYITLNISHRKEKWFNKKYNKFYYGIKIYKKEIDNFLNIVPLCNKEKLEKIKDKFFI